MDFYCKFDFNNEITYKRIPLHLCVINDLTNEMAKMLDSIQDSHAELVFDNGYNYLVKELSKIFCEGRTDLSPEFLYMDFMRLDNEPNMEVMIFASVSNLSE
jgi:hypothetical protein